jgi:hypothetical protein
MNAPGPSQSPVAKAGWLIALIFVGWLAFLFVPGPKPESKPAPPYVKPPPSRLVALGLPDNPDLEHLPEFFALWADRAEWVQNRTKFAFWNPGSNSYSYFFEAIRENGKIQFHSISISEACRNILVKIAGTEGDFEMTGDSPTPSQIATMDLYDESATHPFVFFQSGANDFKTGPLLYVPERPESKPARTSLIELKKNLTVEPIKLTQPELKLSPLDLEQKK